jgi:hypothetical protein
MDTDAQELVSCVNLSIPMVVFPTTGQLPFLAVPSFLTTDEADANLDEYLPDGTPMTAV